MLAPPTALVLRKEAGKKTNVRSRASLSLQAQEQQQQHQHLNESLPSMQLYFSPQYSMQPLTNQHVMASTECVSMNELPLSEHVEATFYPPLAPLNETPLPLKEIQASVMGVSVKLLPGKYFKIMRKYLPVRDISNSVARLIMVIKISTK